MWLGRGAISRDEPYTPPAILSAAFVEQDRCSPTAVEPASPTSGIHTSDCPTTASVREALLRYNGCRRAAGCQRYASAVFSQTGRAVLLGRLTPLPPAAASAAAPADSRTSVVATTAAGG
jgi:hypothetical protein